MKINLNCDIAKNANMGIEAIDAVKTKIEDEALRKTVLAQRDKLEKLKNKAVDTTESKCTDAEPSCFQSAMLKAATKLKASFDKSNTNIAEMLIEGYNMGINDLISSTHKAEKAGQQTPDIVGDTLSLYECCIKELRQYV
jgi:hypothetical protein